MAARVLLVEFLTTDRLRQYRSDIFPFVRGLCTREGVPLEWLCFGHEPDPTPEARHSLDFGDDQVAALERIAAELRPTHVLLNQALRSAAAETLRRVAPGATVAAYKLDEGLEFHEVVDLTRWLGLPAPADGDRRLIEAVAPDWTSTPADRLAARVHPFVLVPCGPICLYARRLVRNPAYAEVELPPDVRPVGCAFCGERGTPRYDLETPADELAAGLVEAAERTVPEWRRSGDYLMTGSAAFLRIGRFLERVLAADVAPGHFWFYCRIDELRRRAATIEALLPRMAAAGHTVDLFAMGVENFSPPENERLNKGIGLDDIEAAFGAIERWERDHPQAFRFHAHGGFSFILFTPWTTIADLRFNVEQAERYRFDAKPFFFTSRLQLFTGRAVTALARRDRVVADAFDDPAHGAFDSGCVTEPGQVEIPWRFQSAEVSAVYSVAARLWGTEGVERDPLTARVRALVRRLPAEEPRALYRLFAALLDAAESGDERPSPDALLDAVEAQGPALGLEPAEAPGLDPAEKQRAAAGRQRLEAALRDVLGRAVAHPSAPLGGFRPHDIRGCETAAGWGELHLELRRGDERLQLVILPRGVVPAAFVETARFAMTFAPETPPRTDVARRAARVILKGLERLA